MLPILIMLDSAPEPEDETPHEASFTEIELEAIRELCFLLPQADTRTTVTLGPTVTIRYWVPPVTQVSPVPGSLHGCEQFLKLLVRRRADSLGCRQRTELRRFLHTTTPTPSSIARLSPETATWLLWAMNWRGISTPRQLVCPPLHAPTLLVQWWSIMPSALCFGSEVQLLRVLADCAARLYRVWEGLVKYMRASGRGEDSLDPRRIGIKFKPRTPRTNSTRGIDRARVKTSFAGLICPNLPTNDRVAV